MFTDEQEPAGDRQCPGRIPKEMQNGQTSNGATGVKSKERNIIMGAGPAGLCSAYVLSKAGANATVVESAPFVGGLARTIRRNTENGEFKFDIGGHRWL